LSFAAVRAWRWLTALVIAAVALWCTRGLLDIVTGPAGAVTRVAMLPPLWLLGILVVVLGAAGVVAFRSGADPDIALPLCALGVLILPYLPWLPDRLPVLRAAAGPGRYLVWPVVLWLIACRDSFGLWRRLRPLVSPLVIFMASAIAFGAVASRMTDTPLFPGGDEPHYLVITQSLLRDRDLKIENNHRREDYREYFNGSLKPDYLALGKDGQIYSIHPVGLPVLAMPAFAVGLSRRGRDAHRHGRTRGDVVVAMAARHHRLGRRRDIRLGGHRPDGSLSLQLLRRVSGSSRGAGGVRGAPITIEVESGFVPAATDRRPPIGRHRSAVSGMLDRTRTTDPVRHGRSTARRSEGCDSRCAGQQRRQA